MDPKSQPRPLGWGSEGGSGGETGRNVGERPVGTGLVKLIDAVAAGGNADDADAGAVAGTHVAGGVADGDRVAVGQLTAGDERAAAQRRCGDLGPVRGIGAVAAEGEEAVEAG